MCRLGPVRRNLSGTSESVNMSILWKNPAAASRDGILRSWGCLGYLIQLASLARESAFVKKLQISTTFERSGRPARRRLTFIGSQNPNQTKRHLKRCLFVWLGWMDSNHRNATVKVWCLTTWLQPNIKKKDFLWKSFFLVGWVVGFEPTIFSATN